MYMKKSSCVEFSALSPETATVNDVLVITPTTLTSNSGLYGIWKLYKDNPIFGSV